MFFVAIKKPTGAKWVDHEGKEMDFLVFSKESKSAYFYGYSPYPLESLGSLYRNIDNIRESPLESRSDWEIRIPSIYSSPDGTFSTVDLLYWIEGVNENAGNDFNLIGCEAFLIENATTIYCGVVESISNNGGTTSIRISDFLGNLKVLPSGVYTSVGAAVADKWPVKIIEEKASLSLAISTAALSNEPVLWLKFGDDSFFKIEDFFYKASESVFNKIKPSYSEDYASASLLEPVKYDILSPMYLRLDDQLLLDDGYAVLLPALNILSGVYDVPTRYYLLKAGSKSEIVDAWSNAKWYYEDSKTLVYSLGRDIRDKRVGKIAAAVDIDFYSVNANPEDIYARIKLVCGAKTICLHKRYAANEDPPYQLGNPSQLVYNSSYDYFYGYYTDTPMIKINKGKTYVESIFVVHLDCPESLKGVQVRKGSVQSIKLGLKYKAALGRLNYDGLLKIGNENPIIFSKFELNGDVKSYSFEVSQNTTLESLLTLTFTFNLKHGDLYNANTIDQYIHEIEPIQVGYIRAEYIIDVPLKSSKLYASEGSHVYHSPEELAEKSGVKASIMGLLKMAGKYYPVEGNENGLTYGAGLGKDSFDVRAKLRTLAAESATLIKFNPKRNEIDIESISLENIPEIITIGLSAFVHDGASYSFKMESPDRNELLCGVTIQWGKDWDSGKYQHTLSIDSTGSFFDGNPYFQSDTKLNSVLSSMAQNESFGIHKIVGCDWVADLNTAEHFAYNLLRWNVAPMRKAQAVCIYTELKGIDIGSFVSFELPGYHAKFMETAWIVTGRHDNMDSMVTTLELLEVKGLPAIQTNRHLLLEDGGNILLEDGENIKLEGFYG